MKTGPLPLDLPLLTGTLPVKAQRHDILLTANWLFRLNSPTKENGLKRMDFPLAWKAQDTLCRAIPGRKQDYRNLPPHKRNEHSDSYNCHTQE